MCTPYPFANFSDLQEPCTCAPAVVTKYQKRLSGPLLERIDIHVEVPRVDYEKLSGNRMGESSETIRARVQVMCDIQQNVSGTTVNLRSDLTPICASGRYSSFVGCGVKVGV